jgi:adenosine deaminase
MISPPPIQQHTHHKLPTVPIQPMKAKLSLPVLRFGTGEPNAFAKQKLIPDDIYQLLRNAPKNELHVHQGGSSSVEFLSYCLRRAIENGEIDKLPLYAEDGSYQDVYFKDPLTQALIPREQWSEAQKEVLAISNLREYYRYQLQMDNQREYMTSTNLAETTATHAPPEQWVSAAESEQLRKQKEQGLLAYRMTSSKINPYVKNIPAAYLLANAYARDMADENIHYTEYRISPSGNGIGGNNGSNIEDVLSAVHDGFEDARRQLKQRTYNLNYGLLVLFERQGRPGDQSPQQKVERAIALAREVVRLKEAGKYNIVGVDLAGDEANNPVTEFAEAFQIIKDYNARVAPEKRLGITIHAGETTHSKDLHGYESVAKAIELAHDANTPTRIGHGLQIVNSSEALRKAFEIYCQYPKDWERRINKQALIKASPLLAKVIQNKITLEMCPKSNLQTYGIHPGFPNDQFEVTRAQYSAEAYKRHPAVFLSRLGVKIAISSDNRTISNTDVTNEYVKLFRYAGLTYRDFKQMVMNGFEGAFVANPQQKKAIIQQVERQFRELEKSPDRIRAIRSMNGKLSLRQQWILFKDNLIQKAYEVFEILYKAICAVRDEWQLNHPPKPSTVR